MIHFKHGSKLIFWFDESFEVKNELDEDEIIKKDYRIDEKGQISCFLCDDSLETFEQKLDFIAAHLMMTLPSFSKGIVLIPYDKQTLEENGFGTEFDNTVEVLEIDHYEITGVNEKNNMTLLELGKEGILTEKKHWLYDIEKLWEIIISSMNIFTLYFKTFPEKAKRAKTVLRGHKNSSEYIELFENVSTIE